MDEWTLNDLLECSVCLDRLDTSSKVLPCQHTFCKKCLDEIVSSHKELRCPECRVLVDCKVEELPPNVLLMRILEGMKNNPRKRTGQGQGSGNTGESPPTPGSTGGGGEQSSGNLTQQHAARQKPGNIATNHQRQRSTEQQLNESAQPVLNNESSRQYPPVSKTGPGGQPYARAIFDYVSKEQGDLNFKKGDIIVLRRKIDNNWFYGELNGSTGTFPMSYVQIMTPLPLPSSHIPQCKAMYEFRMNNTDEEGCLKFSKGEVITVIRRVDENWAEGRLADKIGIFPISFVEFNNVAKALMKLSNSSQPAPTARTAPPPTPAPAPTPLISTSSPPVPPQSIAIPVLPPPTPLVGQTPAPSSTAGGESVTSPSSSTSSSSSPTASSHTTSTTSSSTESSPSSPHPTPTHPTPSKRYSFPHLMQSPTQGQTPHRYSAEILSSSVVKESSPSTKPAASTDLTTSEPSSTTGVSSNATSSSGDLKRQPSLRSYKKQHQTSAGAAPSASGTSAVVPGPAASPHISLKTPALYIAIYPYKPQKEDELELRRGSVYTVLERCQDGWFKGTSHRTQRSGVFPGNYVAPAKSLPALQAQLRGLNRSSSSSPSSPSARPHSSSPLSASSEPPRLSTPKNRPSKIGVLAASTPPDLPPRSHSPSPSSWQGVTGGPPSSSDTARSSLLVIPPPNVSVPTTPVRGVEKKKDKGSSGGGVSLMRRLTNMTARQSKSPPPPCYSMDNPVFEDSTTTVTSTISNSTSTSSISTPHVHVRSDSCPSKLLGHSSEHTRLLSPASSQRQVKHKDRPSVMNHLTARPVEAVVPGETPTGSHHNHRKSNSLDATSTTGSPIAATDNRKPIKQLVPPVRERFRCIAPYPPNSEYELELRVGDIIYVHKKREDGWYKGTLHRTGRTGLFPASFVESF